MIYARQRRFVEEYLMGCNAAVVARRAGYSERTAHAQSGQLMRKPKIKAAIREAMVDDLTLVADSFTHSPHPERRSAASRDGPALRTRSALPRPE